jgi:hypothetical protein
MLAIGNPCGSVTWPAICPFPDCGKTAAALKIRNITPLIILPNVRDMNWLLLET